MPWFIPRHWNLDDKFLTDEEELLRTLDTIDSEEKTDVIADSDSNNHFPPDSSYHHRQAQGKESGPRLSRVRPRREASRCRGMTPRDRWLVPYKDGTLYGESWTAREPPRVRGSGPKEEEDSHKEGECWTARDLRPAAGTTTEEKYVAKKPISPSKDHRKEDTKEYKVSEPSTLHLAWPSVVCCGSSAPHNRTNFDHEMVLMSSVEKAAEVSSLSRPSARGLTR